jgi:hypothetical protein
MMTTEEFQAAVDKIMALIADRAAEGNEFSFFIWDGTNESKDVAATCQYGKPGDPHMSKQFGDPEHLLVCLTPPSEKMYKELSVRDLGVWIYYGVGKPADEGLIGGPLPGIVYGLNSNDLAAEHIAAYLTTGIVPNTGQDGVKPMLN